MSTSLAEVDLKTLGIPVKPVEPLPGFIMKKVTRTVRKLRPYTHKHLPKEKNPAYAAIKAAIGPSLPSWSGPIRDLQDLLWDEESVTNTLPTTPQIFMRRVNQAMIDLKKEGFSMKRSIKSIAGKPTTHYTLTAPSTPKVARTGMAIVKQPVSTDHLAQRLATEEKALKTKKEQVAALQKDCAQSQRLVDALKVVIQFTAKK